MHPSSPWFEFHPESIGWLHRRHRAGETILEADVLRIAEANSADLEDPVLRAYVLQALRGQLKSPRGRKPRSAASRYRVAVAAALLAEETVKVHEERRLAGTRAGGVNEEPCVEAANRLGDDLHLPRGRSLLNEISAWKREQIKRNAAASAG